MSSSIVFQSLLDFALSILLLLTTWTMAEPGVDEGSRVEGVLGWMECHLWKTEFLLWGLNVSSTWNIVTLTIERFVEYFLLGGGTSMSNGGSSISQSRGRKCAANVPPGRFYCWLISIAAARVSGAAETVDYFG